MRVFLFLTLASAALQLSAARSGAPLPNPGISIMAPPKTKYQIQVDYGVENDLSCSDFWAQSKPAQSGVPATAWRSAFKGTFTAALKAQYIHAKVLNISITCEDPAPKYNSNMKRIRMAALFTPMTFRKLANIKTGLIVGYFAQEAAGTLTRLYVERAGVCSSWEPSYFDYVNPNKYVLCTLGFDGCSSTPWNPTQTTPAYQ